ncbi:MAG: hypothetical protein JSS86_24135 [Cyanobacteria bacterium SZAS LIN-2]|nr:hypothetical protein [Cyanobacteria bacterium SZAS LIN-2]
MSNNKHANACAFLRSAVQDMVAGVTNHLSSARLRLTGEKSSYQFVWIMLDRVSAPAGDTTGETYIWAHTNDADFMVGYPPSLCISLPVSCAAELLEQVVAFAEKEITNYGKVEALMQADHIDRSQHLPHYVGDSESGYQAAHPVVEHDGF